MKPDYKLHDPRGWCGDITRGAALGRRTYVDHTYVGKVHLTRIRLDRGGYDSNGTYFGVGEPLFWCASDDNSVDFVVRASDREAAKQAVRKRLPTATFYR